MTSTTTTISQHDFHDYDDSDTSISVSVIENMKEEYGLFVWPCSIILAEYVWQQRSRFCGASILELGAGTSLPGLVAAKVGANVTLTDESSKAEVLENMRRVCELNNLSCNVKCILYLHFLQCLNHLVSWIIICCIYNSPSMRIYLCCKVFVLWCLLGLDLPFT